MKHMSVRGIPMKHSVRAGQLVYTNTDTNTNTNPNIKMKHTCVCVKVAGVYK